MTEVGSPMTEEFAIVDHILKDFFDYRLSQSRPSPHLNVENCKFKQSLKRHYR